MKNHNLIENEAFQILILYCYGRKMNSKNNTRCNKPKAKQVRKSGYMTLTHCDISKCFKSQWPSILSKINWYR